MRILLYNCLEAPDGLTWIGQIWLPVGDPVRIHPKEALFGIRFTGNDPDELRVKVQAFWDERTASVAQKNTERAEREAARKAAKAAKQAEEPKHGT